MTAFRNGYVRYRSGATSAWGRVYRKTLADCDETQWQRCPELRM